MRAHGQVRFLKISAQLQRRVVGVATLIVGVWLVITLGMAINQVSVSFERMALVREQAKIQSAEERVASYRDSMDDVADDLKKRQDMMESMYEQQFGVKPSEAAKAAELGEQEKAAKKIGAQIPEAAKLVSMETRQIRFAIGLTKIAEARTIKAEQAIRRYGLNPATLISTSNIGSGGPFIPFFGDTKEVSDPRFQKLADALDKMKATERALAGIPTSLPAALMSMTSNFGYRSDPFTGQGAMHAGIDFRGEHGSSILAAADGTVSFVGGMGGYGNCIEITHANGLVTRYAHLAGFTVTAGQKIRRGAQIARMGSTGRSTGTHLHFEVRVNGQAINPMKFLEANTNVLKEQTVAGNGPVSTSTPQS